MIYKSKKGEELFSQLYDTTLDSLEVEYDECVVDTRFGSTHVLILGPTEGKPLFMLHGGNSINGETLGWYLPLIKHYRIYAPDLIGHPGKSAQVQLSTKDLSYGQWATDVVKALNIVPVPFLGTSYGGSIALYTAVYEPEVIEKAILVVPGSIAMASKLSMAVKVMWPLLMYKLFGGEKRILQFVKQIVSEPPELTLKGIQYSFEHLKMTDLLPPLSKEQLQGFRAPTLLITAENDIFFPARKVLPRSQELIVNLVDTEVLEGSSHYPPPEYLEKINQRIHSFLQSSDD
jgi:pimeloyl-ACP methyl ester carboxylesterase